MKESSKKGLLKARCDNELKMQLDLAAKKLNIKSSALIRRCVSAGLNDKE